MASICSPKQNHLLAALSFNALERLLPDLELVSLSARQALHETGARLSHTYFPTTSVVSHFSNMENGSSAETAITGNEGLVGIALFMGGETSMSRAVVQSPGFAYRLGAEAIKQEFKRAEEFQAIVLNFTQALIAQMAQTAACNRYHSVEQQLCRLLLITLDRLDSNHIELTQELIAGMIGVRRERVTQAAGALQDAGLLKYSRGNIEILDRAGLERRVCECYDVVQREYGRLLPR